MGIVEMRRRLMMAASNRDAQMARETVAAANSYGWQRDVAAVLAEMSSRDAAFVRSASASRTTSRSYGGGGDASRAWSTAAHNAYPRYPRTAEHMTSAAGGFGVWSSGWLGNAVGGNMTKLFGSIDLAPVSSPTYSQPGPFGDLAVGFDSANDAFSGGNVFDVDADDDIAFTWVAKHSTLAGTGDMLNKGWNGGLPAYLLAREGTEVCFYVRDATPDAVRVAVTVPVNTWYAGMCVLDNATDKSRIAICPIGGSPTVSAEASTTLVGTLSNAFSFTVGDGSAYTADTGMLLSALYAAEDGACATSLSANLSAALSNFVTYISRR